MAADFTIKSFDRLPSIQAAFTSSGAPVDLSNATSVTFIMRAASGGAIKVNSPAVIVDKPGGLVRYDWAVGDTSTPGSYVAEWSVLWTGGKEQTFPTLTFHSIDVLADLDGA